MGNKSAKNHTWVIREKSGAITIGFNYLGSRYKFAPVSRGRYDNPKDLAIANRVASEIEQAIKLGTFTGLGQWKPKTLVETHKPITLLEIWQQYKVAKADRVSRASQISVWKQVDSCLEYLTTEQKLSLLVTNIKSMVITRLLLDNYSAHVVARVLSDLHAACNLAVKRKLIESNPLIGYKDELPDTIKSERSKECYSIDEVNLIISTFKDMQDKVVPYLTRTRCHYADFIEFLFLTGVRPQLAIALTWGDIKADKIIFNKGFTNGVATDGKTGRVTHYPLYTQLLELINRIRIPENVRYVDVPSNDYCLVFSSPTGKHINLKNFTQRIWKPVIEDLVSQGKLTKYLPTYHCRHSTATLLAKAGIPSSTIAALLDTSESMLNKHYLDNQELTNVVIPDLLG